jgi:hypothetical protein
VSLQREKVVRRKAQRKGGVEEFSVARGWGAANTPGDDAEIGCGKEL